MKRIRVKLEERSYDIVIGSDILRLLGSFLSGLGVGRDAYVITNDQVKKRFGAKLALALKKKGYGLRFHCVPDSERAKSLGIVSSVIADLARYDKKRKIFIVAFGGGVIGDLAGFIASVYKRGIAYIQIPTTLLAQVDSSIGGKTAIDLDQGKNLMGAFYQPRLVVSDLDLLRTLPAAQLKSAMAEVIKYAVIKDPHMFEYLEKHYRDIFSLDARALEFIVNRSSRIKAAIVEQDEQEKRGIRTVLNFGHTIGHALETAGGYKKYSHGEAVALGMLVALDISRRMGFTNKSVSLRIENVIRLAGLPLYIKGLSFSGIIEAHYRDKKFLGRKNRFVLIRDIGRTVIAQDVPLAMITAALKALMK